MKKQQIVTIVIANPKGSCNVYSKDRDSERFRLLRIMPKGMSFPCDFGYIPDTAGVDGRPLPAIIVSDCSTFVGCEISCRIVGGLLATATVEDGRSVTLQHFLALPTSAGVQPFRNLAALPTILIENLKSFLINDHAAMGNKLKFTGKLGHKEAMTVIEKASNEQDLKFKLELVLPQTDRTGKPFPQTLFDELNRELIKNFTGLTVYSRLLAEGFWKNDDRTVQQKVVVYQLMLPCLDYEYWQQLKANLEQKFKQTEVMITYGPSRKLK